MVLGGFLMNKYKSFVEIVKGRFYMSLLDAIIIILLIMWLTGYSFRFGGNLIHTLLVIALIILILRLLGVA